jgi:hypothetical protein
MSYRVFWTPHAEQRLEELLNNLSTRDRIAHAARDIDKYLTVDALSFGESRYDTVRIGFVWPLGAQFEVLEDVITVIVYDVWRIDIRKSQ